MLGIVLELDHQKHRTLKRLPGSEPGPMLLGSRLSLLFTSYTALARRGLMIVHPLKGKLIGQVS